MNYPEVIHLTSDPTEEKPIAFQSFFFLTTLRNREVYVLKYQIEDGQTVTPVKEEYAIIAKNAMEQMKHTKLFHVTYQTLSFKEFSEKYKVEVK